MEIAQSPAPQGGIASTHSSPQVEAKTISPLENSVNRAPNVKGGASDSFEGGPDPGLTLVSGGNSRAAVEGLSTSKSGASASSPNAGSSKAISTYQDVSKADKSQAKVAPEIQANGTQETSAEDQVFGKISA